VFYKDVGVEVINSFETKFSRYKLLIAPMLYMIRPGVGEKIEEFVESGGVFIATYWSGIVDENDLCFLGGFPAPLRKVLGIWSEEIDALTDTDVNYIAFKDGNALGLSSEYQAGVLCDLIHVETAEVLAEYKLDFYAGRPALTLNHFVKGQAYYIASRNEQRFLCDFYEKLTHNLRIKRVLDTKLPRGVTAQMRTDGEKEFVFILNFTPQEKKINLGKGLSKDLLTKEEIAGNITLKPYGLKIVERKTVSK